MEEKRLIQLLNRLGISQIEAEVYLDLLTYGKSKSNEIANRLKRHRSNIYDALKKLKETGFISEINEEGTNFYNTGNPLVLVDYLEKEKEELKKGLMQASEMRRSKNNSETVYLFHGIAKVRGVLMKILSQKKEIILWDMPKNFNEIIGRGFANTIRQQVIDEKIQTKILYSDWFKGIKKIAKSKFVEARYLNEGNFGDNSAIMCGNSVYFLLFTDPINIIEIDNSEFAAWFQEKFSFCWKKAKKVE